MPWRHSFFELFLVAACNKYVREDDPVDTLYICTKSTICQGKKFLRKLKAKLDDQNRCSEKTGTEGVSLNGRWGSLGIELFSSVLKNVSISWSHRKGIGSAVDRSEYSHFSGDRRDFLFVMPGYEGSN